MLRCEVSDPTDVSYGWLHDGHSLESSERRFQEGSNLKFIAVDRQLDAGNFVCVARDAATGEELRSTNASFNIKCELSLLPRNSPGDRVSPRRRARASGFWNRRKRRDGGG